MMTGIIVLMIMGWAGMVAMLFAMHVVCKEALRTNTDEQIVAEIQRRGVMSYVMIARPKNVQKFSGGRNDGLILCDLDVTSVVRLDLDRAEQLEAILMDAADVIRSRREERDDAIESISQSGDFDTFLDE